MYNLFGVIGIVFACLAVGFIVALLGVMCDGGMRKEDARHVVIAAMIFAFLAGLCFVLSYHTMKHCPNCREVITTSYCEQCGTAVNVNTSPVCPECGTECDTPFCGECGTSMNAED